MSAVVAIEALLAARTLWHAGRSAAIAADGEPTGHVALDALLPQGGWPRRALTELLLPADGVGELSLLLPTLARCTQAGERVAVIAPPYLPYAPAWQAAGVDLSQLRIIDASPRDALWAFEQCLRSGACAVVLGWPQQADARALRRLQVAADSGQCLGFALRDRKHAANPSPAALRLEAVCTERAIAWQVRKCRGGPVPAMPFVLEPMQTDTAATSVPVAQLPSARTDREVADRKAPARLAPSPANGGGLGWGQAGRDATARAFGAGPSAFGTFPRERGKGRAVPDAHVASGTRDVALRQIVVSPGPVAQSPVSAIAPAQERDSGSKWRPAQPDVAALATVVPTASTAKAFAGSARRTSAHPQHELQFVPAPASLARD